MAKGRTPHGKTTQVRRRTDRASARRRVRSPTGEGFSQALLTHALALVYVIDASGMIHYVSPAITRLLGYQPADVSGHESFSFVHPDDVPLFRDTLAGMLRQPGGSGHWQYRVRHADGTWRMMAGTATNLLDTPAIGGIVMEARDITEERRCPDEGRRASAERYRLLFDSLADTVITWTVDGIMTAVNPAVHGLLGWTPAELIGQHYSTVFPSAAHALAEDSIRHAQPAAALIAIDLACKNGTTVPVEARLSPLYDGAGDRAGVVSVFRARVLPLQRDTAAPAHVLLSEQIVAMWPDLLYVYDLDHHALVYVNQQASLLGRTPEELQRTPQLLPDLVHPDDRAALHERYQRLRTERGYTPADVEYRVRHVNGEWRWFADRVTVLHRTAEGRPVRVLGVAQDITERKRLERLLQQREVQPTALGERLRKFRDSLGLTQEEFGRTFGNYKATQISTYENGVATIPTELLVALWAKGFPLEVIFGASPTEIIEKTALYFTTRYAERRVTRKILEAVIQQLHHDETFIASALRELELTPRGLLPEQKKLLDAFGLAETETDDLGGESGPPKRAR